MIEVLLWAKTDEEVKYACVEMLNHLGLPYREIEDLKTLNGGESKFVLILPEASRLSREEFNLMWQSSCSVIFVNYLSEMLVDKLKVRIIDMKKNYPPKISGVLKVDGVDTVPFFYDFPMLESKADLVEKVGEIEAEGAKYVGVMLSKPNSRPFAIIVPQIFRSAAYLLTGGEETLPLRESERVEFFDRFGRINGRKTEIARQGFLHVPIVNVYEELLLQLLLDFSERNRVPLVRKWLYPRNCDAAMCASHDVEYVVSAEAGIDAVNSFRKAKLLDGFAKGFLALLAVASALLVDLRLFRSRRTLRLVPLFFMQKLVRFNSVWNFDKFLGIEKEFGVVSSFYFLKNEGINDSDYDFQHPLILEATNLVKENGCKVSLHASFNSCNDKEQLRNEKGELEEVLGAKVGSVRQHYYRFKVPETWRHQEDADFSCDSSLGYAQLVGFRAGTCLPFKPFDYRRKKVFSITEVPRIIEDGVLLQEQYMALSFREAFETCKNLIEATVRHHGVLTLGWHESVDREWTRGWLVLYKKILQYCSRFNLWKTTVEDLATRFDMLRAITIEKLPTVKNSFEIGITSPNFIEDFALKIHMPFHKRILEISSNHVPVDYWENTNDRTLDVCLNLKKGINMLKMVFFIEKPKEE